MRKREERGRGRDKSQSGKAALRNSPFLLTLRAFLLTLRHADAIQSGSAPAPRGARPALLCDEGAGERFVFSRLKSRQGKIQIEVDAASKSAGVISLALEEEGGVITLCSCLLC